MTTELKEIQQGQCTDSKQGVEQIETNKGKDHCLLGQCIKWESQSSQHCSSLKTISEWVISIDGSLQSNPLSLCFLLLYYMGRLHARSLHHACSYVVPVLGNAKFGKSQWKSSVLKKNQSLIRRNYLFPLCLSLLLLSGW